MGRSGTISHHHSCEGTELRLEEYSLSFQYPSHHHHRQWQAVRLHEVLRLLLRPKNQPPILLPSSPTGEWPSRGHKQTYQAKAEKKKKLGAKKGAWSELLPEVLWAYHCTKRTSRTFTGETPYSLAFGAEAVIPIEVGIPTHRVTHYTPEQNNEQLNISTDLLEEHRLRAALHLATYQQRTARYYDQHVRERNF